MQMTPATIATARSTNEDSRPRCLARMRYVPPLADEVRAHL